MQEIEVPVPVTVAERLFERCWSVASKLESQIARNPNLPSAYRQIVSEAFESLRDLDERTKSARGGA